MEASHLVGREGVLNHDPPRERRRPDFFPQVRGLGPQCREETVHGPGRHVFRQRLTAFEAA
jgi:hypothetical protein